MPQTASAGTNLYAWCGNNPVSREDPSGMAWNFRSIGARLMGGVGAALGAIADYAVGYVSNWGGGGGYGGYGYSGGGYGYSGYSSGRRSKQAAKQVAKVAASLRATSPSSSKFRMDPAKATFSQRNFLGTPAGNAYFHATGAYSFSRGSGHRKTRNQVIASETFKADGMIDIDDKDQGGKEVVEYYHTYHSNVEAPLMAAGGLFGIGAGVGLEIGCIGAGAGVGGIACAPAAAGIIAGSGAFAYGNYELWQGSATYKAISGN